MHWQTSLALLDGCSTSLRRSIKEESDDCFMEMNGPSVLVLGAGGFLGTNLCNGLLSRGYQVRGFGRSQQTELTVPNYEFVKGDFADRTALARVVDGADYIFHLLGGSTPESSNRDPQADLIGTVSTTLRLLDTCRTSRIRKLVFISSGGTVYGIPTVTPLPETAPTNPISAYGVNKLTVEKYLLLYSHLYGLDYSVLRLSNPYGPYQDPLRRQGLVAAITFRALSGQPVEIWGDGNVIRDYIFVEDAITAMIDTLTYNGPHKIFNIGCGVGRSVNELITSIEAAVGRSIARTYMPGRKTDTPINVLDISLIGHEIGWSPQTPFEAALRRTAEWMRATHV